MSAATKSPCFSKLNDLTPPDSPEHLPSSEFSFQVKCRVFRTLVVCDDVLEVERADKHFRSLGVEPETVTCPSIPSSIQRELAGDSENTWWIPHPIIVTKQGFRNLRSKLGESQSQMPR